MAMQKKPNKIPVIFIGIGGLVLVLLAIYLVMGGSVSSNVPDQRITAADVTRVSVSEAYTAYQDRSAVFLDVRGAESFDAGHIPGAVHIPLDELASRLNELSKDDWILTYCT
jgi:rhodanese-related sulfurtransferase